MNENKSPLLVKENCLDYFLTFLIKANFISKEFIKQACQLIFKNVEDTLEKQGY